MAKQKSLVPIERIEQAILLIRGQKVMLDADLAKLYGVSTKVLNQAVKRNQRRFPADFMFRLTKHEKKELVTNCDRFILFLFCEPEHEIRRERTLIPFYPDRRKPRLKPWMKAVMVGMSCHGLARGAPQMPWW